MKDFLINKLFEYIRDNNPDILFALEAEDKLRIWLYDKVEIVIPLFNELKSQNQPDYIIEETCLNELTKELKPSRYNYILNILEEEFEATCKMLSESGVLQYQTINMVNHCESTFDDLKFSEDNEENQFIRYAIIGAVNEYLESNRVNETVGNELQQSAET